MRKSEEKWRKVVEVEKVEKSGGKKWQKVGKGEKSGKKW